MTSATTRLLAFEHRRLLVREDGGRPGIAILDPAELAEAHWCSLDELPPVPPSFSIARSLIDAWVRERGGDPSRLVTWPG